MENQVRYVDLGLVSKEMYTAIWEYDNLIDLKDPILIKFSTDKTLVSFWQGPYWDKELKEWKNLYTDLTDYFYSPELLDIDKLRYYQKVVIPYDAEVCYCVESPDVTNFIDRKSTRLNSSHKPISYAVFCLKKKKTNNDIVLLATIMSTMINAQEYRYTQ